MFMFGKIHVTLMENNSTQLFQMQSRCPTINSNFAQEQFPGMKFYKDKFGSILVWF